MCKNKIFGDQNILISVTFSTSNKNFKGTLDDFSNFIIKSLLTQ